VLHQEACFLVSASVLIVIPFVLVALLALALAAAAWKRTRSPSSILFTLAALAIVLWVGVSALETSTQSLELKIIWAKMAYLGLAWVSALWLLFIFEYTNPEGEYSRRLALWMLLLPVISIGLVLTNDAHAWVWRKIVPTSLNGELYLVYRYGWWFWITTVFSYTALVTSVVLLLRAVVRYPRVYRGQLTWLAAGMAIPWLANILYLSGLGLRPGIDPTPYGFALTALIFGWVFFRFGLFEVVPLAYEAILNNISDGYLVVDGGGKVIEISTACCHYLGLERGAVTGHPVSEVLRDWKGLLRLLRMAGAAQAEIPIESMPNLWLEASASDWLLHDRQVGGRLLILHDITRRRQAEENLRTSERMYRLLVDAAPVGILMTDTEGEVTFASPTMLELYQAAGSDEVVGYSMLRWVHPDDRTEAVKRMLSVIEDQQHLAPVEFRLLRTDATIFWGEVASTPMVDQHGNSLGLLAIIRDVTVQRNLRMQLQRNLERETFINTLLEILHRSHDLRAALSQVLEQIGVFTGASRVYICQDSADGAETSLVYEWSAAEYPPRMRDTVLVRYAAIPTWKQRMLEKGIVTVRNELEDGEEELPEDLAEFLSAWNVLSLVAFPMYGSEENLYGFLAVDACGRPRVWSTEDIDMLGLVCRIVSGAVARIQAETAEQRQRALAEALHDTAAAMNSTLNQEEVLDRVLSNLERVVQNVAANIALVDEDGVIRFVRWLGYPPEADSHFRSLRVNCFEMETYCRMALTGAPVIIEDTWADKGWIIYEPMTWIRSYAAMPIRSKGKITGFINIDSSEPDFFTEDLSYSLGVFAEQAAVAIENARLYDTVQHRAEEMSILNRIAVTLTAGLETEQVLMALFDECRQVLPIDVFSVAVYDMQTGCIELPLLYNDGDFQTIAPWNIADSPGITGMVIRNRHTLYLPDSATPEIESQYGIKRLGGTVVRAYVGVPLILLDQVVGVISMQNYEPHAYSPEQIRLFEMIATQAAIAVQNARLYDQMKHMAITDAVTGLFTRRHFTSMGSGEVERALRYNRQLSVLMVDLDHFKLVNDTYGHNSGDVVLQIVAQVCRQALRATDIVGRWGGEEFAIVLPEADSDGASLIAERIRRMMAEQEMRAGNNIIHVTVSIGVATLSQTYNSLEILIDRADRALYMAKQSGRNRVRLIEGD